MMQQNRAAQGFVYFAHNDQLCKQMWLLLEKKRHNWAPEMAPQSELQFGTPNCVSLYFRRRKPTSGARFGARTRTAFWDPFQMENCADNKIPCSVYFFGPMSKKASTL